MNANGAESLVFWYIHMSSVYDNGVLVYFRSPVIANDVLVYFRSCHYRMVLSFYFFSKIITIETPKITHVHEAWPVFWQKTYDDIYSTAIRKVQRLYLSYCSAVYNNSSSSASYYIISWCFIVELTILLKYFIVTIWNNTGRYWPKCTVNMDVVNTNLACEVLLNCFMACSEYLSKGWSSSAAYKVIFCLVTCRAFKEHKVW